MSQDLVSHIKVYFVIAKRLPFGVHSAPAIFQRAMEGLLRDIPSTITYLDDILITGKTAEEHLQNLNSVLSHLERTLGKSCYCTYSRERSSSRAVT